MKPKATVKMDRATGLWTITLACGKHVSVLRDYLYWREALDVALRFARRGCGGLA